MKSFFLFSFFLLAVCVQAQQLDSLFTKIQAYGRSQYPVSLFVQTDKHIYLNNEWLWFSGYIVSQVNDTAMHHEMMAIFLVPADTRKPVLQQKFIMSNGLGYGSIHLPDSIPPGQYKLIACTNVVSKAGVPVAIFAQDINIHSVTETSFTAAVITAADQQLMITVRDKTTGMPLAGAMVETRIDRRTITSLTDKNGLCLLSLKAIGYNAGAPAIIRAKVKYRGEFIFLEKMMDPVASSTPLELHFFPEGGYLINQLPCRVGVESTTINGEPLSVKAVLYKNNVPEDTIKTDAQGLGVFAIRPDVRAAYSVQVLQLPPGVTPRRQGYVLPQILSTGMSIRLPSAITGDTVSFQIYSSGYTQIKMIVHNFQQVFEADSFPPGSGIRNVLLLLDKLPKGIAAITLLDNENHPLAERIFFAHYDRSTPVTILPDKKILSKREKVTVQFLLPDSLKNKGGFISVTCAQASRFSNSMQQDIESFVMQQVLQELPPPPHSKWYTQKDFLENVLLVRGWRRYSWAALYTAPQQAVHSPLLSGFIISRRKNKQEGLINILGDGATAFQLPADETGRVYFSYNQLAVSQDRQLIISAVTKNESNLRVKMSDPFLAIADSIAGSTDFKIINATKFAQYSQDLLLADLVRQKQLANVTVVAKKNQGDRWIGTGRVNECGDYVCSYNILNCTNHIDAMNNTFPVVGHMYVVNGLLSVYNGCRLRDPEKTDSVPLAYDGIKLGKEFYPEDFSKKTSAYPENLSTLFWSPGLYFNKNGIATCSFYTGDITGKFRIVINGTTGEDLFSATELIEVR
ncbi:MAG TPA: hypothetical protein VK645_02350 [Chitinophagaceae bacterium]|nr:hypothetical protein [Chitinophagaceae bacterium]